MGEHRERSSSSNERRKDRGDNRKRSRSDSKNNKRKQNRVVSESRSRSNSKNRDRNNGKSNSNKNNNTNNNTKRYRSRSRSDSRDRDERRSRNYRPNNGPQSYSKGSNNHRFNHEEMKAKRIQERSVLRIRKTVWDYSTDEEDYEDDITVFWSTQEKERSLMNEEQKQKEERRRLRKLRKIQRKASNQGSDEEDSDTVSNDSQDSSDEGEDGDVHSEQDSSDLDSDNHTKTRKLKKGKTTAGKKNKKKVGSDDSSDDENGAGVDPAGNESEDSFAELCREKINGPDPKKVKQQQKAALARKKALAALAASMAADNENTNEGMEAEKPVLDQAEQEEQMLKLLDNLTDEDEEEEINNVEKDYDKYMIDTMGPVGPMPLLMMESKRDMNYTGLMPGEGDAIAHYVEEGKRIPRRGEVGLTSEQIQRFEDLGYVMSGSRHKRMNAVREMKEAKVISQQEKKAIAIYNYQQKNKTEVKLDAYFKGMLEEKLEENKRKNPKG